MLSKSCMHGDAGLRNGAFYVEPRPVFFAHMMGIRAPLKARPIVMKALGMWHWEVHIDTCHKLFIPITIHKGMNNWNQYWTPTRFTSPVLLNQGVYATPEAHTWPL